MLHMFTLTYTFIYLSTYTAMYITIHTLLMNFIIFQIHNYECICNTSTIGQLTKHYQEHSIHIQQQQILSLQTQAVLHEK